METKTLETKLVIENLVKQVAPDNKDKINVDTDLFNEGFIDSLGVMHLISFIESSFEIEIQESDFELEHFRSINSIANFLNEKYLNK